MQINDFFKIKTILLNAGVAIVYFLSAKGVSFLSLTDGGNVFVVWPPTGVALAALLMFGRLASVGIFVGALLLNSSIVSLPLSIHISIGNTVGPLLCLYMLERLGHKQNFMLSLDGVYAFFVSVLVGSVVTASNGISALFLWNALPSGVAWGMVWYAWFVGDLIGFVVVTSLLLSLRLYWKELLRIRVFEFIALIALTSLIEYAVFGLGFFEEGKNYPMAYMALPPILWAVFRFTPPVSILSVNIISFFAILGTITNRGPFAGYGIYESLALLQTFIGISAMTVLLVVGVMNERELANKELEKLNATLSERVKEEIAKTNKHQNMLAQQSKMAAMGEMIGAIAHQWRQPLNALGLMVQDIKMAYKYGELTDEYVDNMVHQSMSQIGFMSKTIDDFRNFFRPDKQKINFNMFGALLESIRLMEAQLRVNNIDIKIKCPREKEFYALDHYVDYKNCDEYLVFGYPNEFKQVVLNLLSNSKDAILSNFPNGNGLLLVSLKEENEDIVLSVEDNGGGICKEVGDRIFEPYFTTKEQGRGTGIGLYMSKMIIEDNMNGSLGFYSGENGAVFVVRLARVA